ncbi:Gfo/Idh/MocA family oxidoreductase [soil metagenome]
MNRPRVVIVGAGGIAGAWLPGVKAEDVEVVAVVDLQLEAAQRRIDEFDLGAKASTSLEEVLAAEPPDFVLDLTVPEARAQVVTRALEAGCHVLSEKPMAASMAEARGLLELSEATGKLFAVSQNRRWDANHAQIKEALHNEVLGAVAVGMVNCAFYLGAHFGGFRDEMANPLLLDMAIHHFDLARFFSGAEPLAVYAKGFNPQGSWYKGDAAASCIFEMTNGLVFNYQGSWCAEGQPTSWNGDWRFVGERGSILYERDATPKAQVIAKDEGFQRPLKDLELPAAPVLKAQQHGTLAEMLNFLQGGPRPSTEAKDNIKSLAMVFGAVGSARAGERVVLNV